ncbi:MAG: peptide deformylase [Thermomicrobiales bacterium]
MALREIILEGDPRLRQKAMRVKSVNYELRALAEDMFETMLDAPGVGLAAPQVGVSRRLIVARLPAGFLEEDDPEFSVALVNPEIVRARGRQVGSEGCLSIPGWVGDVPRFDSITIKALTLDNKSVRLKAEGYPAVVLQHEIDHLDGVLFTDRIEDRETLRRVEDDDAVEVVTERDSEVA